MAILGKNVSVQSAALQPKQEKRKHVVFNNYKTEFNKRCVCCLQLRPLHHEAGSEIITPSSSQIATAAASELVTHRTSHTQSSPTRASATLSPGVSGRPSYQPTHRTIRHAHGYDTTARRACRRPRKTIQYLPLLLLPTPTNTAIPNMYNCCAQHDSTRSNVYRHTTDGAVWREIKGL